MSELTDDRREPISRKLARAAIGLIHHDASEPELSNEMRELEKAFRLILAGNHRAAASTRTEAVGVKGVDGQVLLAARDMEEEQKLQPEWLWFSQEGPGTTTFGRWAKFPRQAPYIRADLVLSCLTPPTPKVTTDEAEQRK